MQEALQTLAGEFDLGAVEYDVEKNLVRVTDTYDGKVTESSLAGFLRDLADMYTMAEAALADG